LPHGFAFALFGLDQQRKPVPKTMCENFTEVRAKGVWLSGVCPEERTETRAERIFIMRKALVLTTVVVLSRLLTAGEHEPVTQFTPDEALARLKNGNLRFVEGKAKHPRGDAVRRSETVKDGQHPIAIVIGCADSREPVEIIFDQGIGDVFVVRVAGNVCNSDEIGSAEYAAEHLGAPLCIVLGHTACGAVTAAATDAELHGCVGALVNDIRPAVAVAQMEHPDLKSKALVPAAIEANVKQSIGNLKSKSPVLSKLISSGKLHVEGGVYDLESGQIKWLSADADGILKKVELSKPYASEHAGTAGDALVEHDAKK
jgi:carbonic anhydrase